MGIWGSVRVEIHDDVGPEGLEPYTTLTGISFVASYDVYRHIITEGLVN